MALLLSVGVKAKQTIVYQGEFATGKWASSLSIDKSAFANMTEGDILYVGWSKDTEEATAASEEWYQITITDGSWSNTLVNSYNGAYVFCYVHTLTAAEVTSFKRYGHRRSLY